MEKKKKILLTYLVERRKMDGKDIYFILLYSPYIKL